MTCREKLKLEHPDKVGDGFIGGCCDCPFEYGYVDEAQCRADCAYDAPSNDACGKCWDREIPNTDDINPSNAFNALNVTNDNVNHPSHYETGKIECIEAMIETQGLEAVQSFCVCNAFKYIWRHRNKNHLEDVKKAIWYLNKFVELEESR